ncbi:MAG: DUF1365 domain-containing protein [Planctomycetota bacterium]
MPQSAIYEGVVEHRRRVPADHAFTFRLFMVYLDLAELDEVFGGTRLWSATRPTLAYLRRRDYLGPTDVPLDCAVRDRVEAETGRRPVGPIRMLTHLRTLGYVFNPVTFYYCFAADGQRVDTIVAEITNTPWRERRAYVLTSAGAPNRDRLGDPSRGRGHRFRFDKDFHVSPFMPMALGYDWRFTEPGDQLGVHMELTDGGAHLFSARLQLSRRDITPGRLRGLLLRYPLLTARVFARIHWEALRLWWKRCPVYPHPTPAPARRTPGS